MKKLLLAFSFALLLFTANAQRNILFPDSSAQWSVQEWDGFGNPAGYVNYYLTNADTIINSQVYHKVFVWNQAMWISPPTGYNAAIRKDAAAKKVYVVPKDS